MVTPDQRSRECIRRYFGFRTTSPRRHRGQVAASTRASPPHAWRWGTWGRCRRAWARSVRGLSTAAVCRGRSPGRGAVLETSSAFALSFGHTMRRLGSVQRKMPCVFVTEVKEEPSTKREHQVPRCAAPWSGRAGAAGRYRAALQVGSFFAIFAGEVWDTGLYSPSSRFSYLVSCKGGNLREKFSDEAIQTCRLVEIESPHLK